MRGLHPGFEDAERLTSETPSVPSQSSLSKTGSDPLAAPKIHGRFEHPVQPIAPRRTVFPGARTPCLTVLIRAAMDTLSCFAIAVNECVEREGTMLTRSGSTPRAVESSQRPPTVRSAAFASD